MPDISGAWLYGLGGAGIAFLTYVLRRRAQRTKLVVNVKCFRELFKGSLNYLALDVRVVSNCHFDVTISKIGLRVRKNWYSRQRFALRPTDTLSLHDLSYNKSLPFRLDARGETTFRIPIRKKWWFADGRVPTIETVLTATDVYVETSTENRFYGRGVGLKTFLDAVREADLPKLRHWDK